MSKRKRKKPKKKKFLDGHKREGKKFIPPLMQLSMNTSVSYVNDILPELIWVGLINERVGYISGTRVIEKVFLAVEEIKEEAQQGNFALMSSYKILNESQKNTLKEKLVNEGVLYLIQNSIAPLVLLYDDCPLSFIGPPSTVYKKDDLVMTIKRCVERVIDKYDTPGIVQIGAMLISRLVTKKIEISSDIELPDLNSVIEAPDSEEAKHAAGFIRSTTLGEFAYQEIDPSWSHQFWDTGVKISPCEFMNEESDSE